MFSCFLIGNFLLDLLALYGNFTLEFSPRDRIFHTKFMFSHTNTDALHTWIQVNGGCFHNHIAWNGTFQPSSTQMCLSGLSVWLNWTATAALFKAIQKIIKNKMHLSVGNFSYVACSFHIEFKPKNVRNMIDCKNRVIHSCLFTIHIIFSYLQYSFEGRAYFFFFHFFPGRYKISHQILQFFFSFLFNVQAEICGIAFFSAIFIFAVNIFGFSVLLLL